MLPLTRVSLAVALVKAGAFGVVRVLKELYGVEFAESLDLLLPLAIVAANTIV